VYTLSSRQPANIEKGRRIAHTTGKEEAKFRHDVEHVGDKALEKVTMFPT